MKMQSRRQFLKSCLYFLMSGVGYACITRGASTKAFAAFTKAGITYEPAYVKLNRSGGLKKRAKRFWNMMENCTLCPRECGVNRINGERGFCGASSQLEIASHAPHFGEEKPLVGKYGSGTIFFTHCSLQCVFCINADISQGGVGQKRDIEDLAEMMLELQKRGCHNINVVTPTHYVPHIIFALDLAATGGLRIPLVYNTCGWERIEVLRQLDGIVDIYLPDFKYSDGEMGKKYSSASVHYPEITQTALREMHRQVGVAKAADGKIIYKGLMVRHLVMPNGVSGTNTVIAWIAANLPHDTYLNIMSQYRPMYKAFQYPEIARPITRQEYAQAVTRAKEAGLTNLDVQGCVF